MNKCKDIISKLLFKNLRKGNFRNNMADTLAAKCALKAAVTWVMCNRLPQKKKKKRKTLDLLNFLCLDEHKSSFLSLEDKINGLACFIRRNVCFYYSSQVLTLAEHRKHGNLAFLACHKPIPQLFTSSRLISFLLLFNRGEVTPKIVDREHLARTEQQNAPLTSVMSNGLVPSMTPRKSYKSTCLSVALYRIVLEAPLLSHWRFKFEQLSIVWVYYSDIFMIMEFVLFNHVGSGHLFR